MSDRHWENEDIVIVVKVGGSVLRSLRAYRQCAQALGRRLAAHPREKLVVVVSARFGHTDRLARLAGKLHAEPDEATRDLLWSTGETHSVALLTLALHQAGVPAAALSVHETGLRLGSDGEVCVEKTRVTAEFARQRVVVVPGFFALDPDRRIVSLGRGGSDLTAVALAVALDVDCCELIKDAGCYFTSDPRVHAGATPVQELSYAAALALAEQGCPVVQRRALQLAEQAGLVIRVQALAGNTGTTIGPVAAPALEEFELSGSAA